MSLSFRSSASGGTAEMVPRQLLLDSQDAVERLRRQLDEALANQDSEVNVAVHTLQAQLRAVQKQQKAAETQLSRSLAREKELRDQVVNADVMSAMGSLRKENKELRERNEKLSEQATKGQEGEAHLIVLRNKLDASQEEVQRLRSGNELELQSTREEVASLKKALEKAQIDMINSEQVLRREKEMQEAIDRSAVLLNEKDRQILELQDELDRASSTITASTGEAHSRGEKVADLERSLRHEKRRAEEAVMLQKEAENSNARHLENIAALERQLEHAQDAFKKLTQRLNETEMELSSVQAELRLLEEKAAKETSSLSSQLKEAESKLQDYRETSNQTERDSRASRDQMRQELQQSESEGKHLREVLRKERDLLEKIMRDHAAKEAEYAEQRQRFEAQASRREAALQTRLQSAEKELDALRLSSVPDSKLRSLQEQFNQERDQLQARLDAALEDAMRAEQQKTISLRSLEQSLASMSTETDVASSKICRLERKVQEAEEAYDTERKARLVAVDQLRAFKGERSLQGNDNAKLSKVAHAAVELIGDSSQNLQRIQDQVSGTSRAKLDGQQRTALGIVVVENTVEMTVPGSPAEACGVISGGDQILAVDGKPVQGSSVMAMLRGDDMIGSVVTVLLRKQVGQEVVEVHLPRTDIALVQQRQSIMDDLAQFSSQAVKAAQAHEPDVLGDRLDKILAGMKALEQLDINVQCKLSIQVMEMRKALNAALKNANQAIRQLDYAHQHAHALQEQTEQDLREQLAKSASKGDGSEQNSSKLIAEVHALGKDKIQLQNELRAKGMLLAEAKQDIDRLREALIAAEEKAIVFEEGQKAMRGTIVNLEEQLADAFAEIIEFPYAFDVRINLDWDATMRDAETRSEFDAHLHEHITSALQIPKNALSTVCFHRDEQEHIVAVIKVCSVMPSGGDMENSLRPAKALAAEFAQRISDSGSGLHDGSIGALLKTCTLHGPLSESTAKALRSAHSDAEKDDGWREDEMRRLREQVKRANARAQQTSEARQTETEALRLENVDLAAKVAETMKQDAAQSIKAIQQDLNLQHQVAMAELRRKHAVDIEDWGRALKTKEYENAVLKEQLAANEVRDSGKTSEMEKGYEIARTVQDSYHKLQVAATQMRDLVEPEIKACITTLNNIESEMGFFHAYQTRALQIAKSIVGESIQNSFDKDEKDAGYSKEMIQRDIDALRSQLDSLAELTSPDGEFARKLNFPRLSIARMTPSRASYGTRGPTAEISQRDPLAAMQSSSSTEEMASVQSSPLSEAASVRPAGGHLIKGCVVEVQNLPVNDLPGTHVSAALSVMPMSADPDEFEHVLPGSKDHVPRRGFLPFLGGGGLSGKLGKSGKPLILIIPQHHTEVLEAATTTKWSEEQQFSLREYHSLEAASAGQEGGGERKSVDGLHVASKGKLSGAGAIVLLTLMVSNGKEGNVPGAHARCVFRVVGGDDLDQWHPLESLDGEVIAGDTGIPASVRLRVVYLVGNSAPAHDISSSLLWKAKDGSYIC